jgi:hypothetical protein
VGSGLIDGAAGGGSDTATGLAQGVALEFNPVDTVFSVKPFTASRSEEGCHRARSGQGQGAPSARGPSLTCPARVPAGRSGRRDDRRTIEQRDDGFSSAEIGSDGIVKLLGASRELGELDGAKAGLVYAACLMPQTSCHAWKARVRSAR